MAESPSSLRSLVDLPAFAANSLELNAIIETPQGSQNKFTYDEQSGLFMLGGALPTGAFFPFEFGFIPSTRGGDGDPLDILILMDAPTFVGCLVRARLVGVILAEQTEAGKTERNDRLIGVAVNSRRHKALRQLRDLPKQLLAEIEHFFISYNASKGKEFRLLGRYGSARALTLVRENLREPREEPAAEWAPPNRMLNRKRF